MRPVPLLVAAFALLVAVGGGADGASLPVGAAFSAAQGAEHAAGLVIATPDGQVRTVCVRFSEEAIDGRELLNRAEAQRGDIDPVYAEFGSRGAGVCALCGSGCPADDCFCQDAYWNYNVAHEGRWVRSGTGVSGRTLEHGDVDGWAFGADGAAPPYLSFERICGTAAEPEPSPTAAAAPSSPAPASPSAAPAPPSPEPAASATAPAGASPPADSPSPAPTLAPPSPTSSPRRSPDPDATGPRPDDTDPREDDGGVTSATDQAPVATPPPPEEASASTGPGSAIAFGAILAALIGATLWRRGRRDS